MRSGSHAQRNCNKELENKGHDGNTEGYPHILTDNLGNGTGINKGITPVSGNKVSQPFDIAFSPRTVKSVSLVKGVNHILGDFASSRDNILYLLADEIVRHQSYQYVKYDRDTQQYQYGKQQSFDYVFEHICSLKYYRGREGIPPPNNFINQASFSLDLQNLLPRLCS